MLKQVQHDKLSEPMKAKWLTAVTIPSLRDDKVSGCAMANRPIVDDIRALQDDKDRARGVASGLLSLGIILSLYCRLITPITIKQQTLQVTGFAGKYQ